MWRRLQQLLRLMIGLPDYERYVQHRRLHHQGEPVLERAAFIAERQRARYGAGSSRCC